MRGFTIEKLQAPAIVRALFVIAGLAAAPAALAQDLPVPADSVVLTVDGSVAVTNAEGVAQFDMAMLKALPAVSFDTTTIWTEGTHTFTGVALKSLLDRLGATGGTVSARAINDYAVTIPVADLDENAPIIAYNIDGEAFSRREKGPLWVVFPYDADEKYRTEVTFGQSIWQLDRLTVAP